MARPITRCPATNAAHEWRQHTNGGYFCAHCLDCLETMSDVHEWISAARAVWFPSRSGGA